MKTTHIVTAHLTLERETRTGGLVDLERTYRASVSLVRGTRDDLEVVWLSDMGELDDLELEGAVEQAEQAWMNAMRGLDSENDEAADAHMARCKEEREAL